MSMEWYYTTNKQQMGPVSWDELRELAEVGILKPHDMVWSEGMDEWVKAINQSGLFADGDEAGVTASPTGKKKSSYSESKPPPGRRTRKIDDDEEDEEDEKEAKRKTRKREEERAKMGIGFRVFLGIGAVVGLLLLGTCVCGGLAYLTWGGRDGPNNPVAGNPPPYSVFNLPEKNFDDHRFTFTQGKRVVITCTNNLQFPNTDVDLRIFRGNNAVPNEHPFAFDDRLPQQNPHCRVEFVVPATDIYRVRVVNLGPGKANRCDVVIQVQ
jgi:GYF domain 2